MLVEMDHSSFQPREIYRRKDGATAQFVTRYGDDSADPESDAAYDETVQVTPWVYPRGAGPEATPDAGTKPAEQLAPGARVQGASGKVGTVKRVGEADSAGNYSVQVAWDGARASTVYSDSVRPMTGPTRPAGFSIPEDLVKRQKATQPIYTALSDMRPIIDVSTGDETSVSALADSALTNALDEAVERGFATKREGDWKGQTIYEPVPGVTDEELQAWVDIRANQGLEGLLDSYGYDKKGKIYPHNQEALRAYLRDRG